MWRRKINRIILIKLINSNKDRVMLIERSKVQVSVVKNVRVREKYYVIINFHSSRGAKSSGRQDTSPDAVAKRFSGSECVKIISSGVSSDALETRFLRVGGMDDFDEFRDFGGENARLKASEITLIDWHFSLLKARHLLVMVDLLAGNFETVVFFCLFFDVIIQILCEKNCECLTFVRQWIFHY